MYSRSDHPNAELDVGHQLQQQTHPILPLRLVPELAALSLALLERELVVRVGVLENNVLVH